MGREGVEKRDPSGSPAPANRSYPTQYPLTTGMYIRVLYRMDTKQVSAWKADLEAEIKLLSEKVQVLTTDLQKKREQLELLRKLIDSEEGTKRSSIASVPAIAAIDGVK